MQVSVSPFREVCSEPMKPHGDAAQLAVNAGTVFLFFEKCSFSARAMYQAGNTGQRRRSSARREHRRRREVGKVIKPGRVPKQLRVSRCKEEMAGLLEEKALQDDVFGVESELIDGSGRLQRRS